MEKQIGVLWDCDGTLWGFKYLPRDIMAATMLQSDRTAIRTLLPALAASNSIELVDDLLDNSRHRYGNAFEGFYGLAVNAGMTAEDFHLRAFKLHYATWYKLIMEQHPQVFDHARAWAPEFRRTQKAVKHGLLTHAAIDEWCAPIMLDIGILEAFDQSVMIGRDQFGFAHKALSTAPLRLGIERMQMPTERIWFAEDDLHNLHRASEIAGVKKVYIHHGKPLPRLYPFVDHQFQDPSEFGRYLMINVLEPQAPGQIRSVPRNDLR